MKQVPQSEIIRMRIENMLLLSKIEGIKKDTARFIKLYLPEISDLEAELRRIEKQINALDIKLGRQIPDATETDIFDKELKRLHRKLVKLTHPDIIGPQGAEYTQIISEAYAARRIAQLIQLDEKIGNPRTDYNQLTAINHELMMEIENIKSEPAYRLKTGLENIHRRNELMSGVFLRLTRQIAFENRRLLARKMELEEQQSSQVVA